MVPHFILIGPALILVLMTGRHLNTCWPTLLSGCTTQSKRAAIIINLRKMSALIMPTHLVQICGMWIGIRRCVWRIAPAVALIWTWVYYALKFLRHFNSLFIFSDLFSSYSYYGFSSNISVEDSQSRGTHSMIQPVSAVVLNCHGRALVIVSLMAPAPAVAAGLHLLRTGLGNIMWIGPPTCVTKIVRSAQMTQTWVLLFECSCDLLSFYMFKYLYFWHDLLRNFWTIAIVRRIGQVVGSAV